jgi:hypothetical protein
VGTWLSIIKLALQITLFIYGKRKDEQLLDAGQALNVSKNLSEALKNVENAIVLRDAVDNTPDKLRDDPFNRDTN